MSSQITAVIPKVFEGHRVRVVMIDGEPWFVGKDVCETLGIANHNDALGRLDDDERQGVGITDPLGNRQTATAINESGLYSLILTSRKPEAKKFKKWVTSEVLPEIRKTGSFGAIDMRDPKQLAAAAAQLVQITQEQKVIIQEQKEKIATLEPKAVAFDSFLNEGGTFGFQEAATQLNMRDDTLIDFLIKIQWIHREGMRANLKARKPAQRDGYVTARKGHPRLTAKGLHYLMELFSVNRQAVLALVPRAA